MKVNSDFKELQLTLGRGDCYHTALAVLFEVRCLKGWWEMRKWRLVHAYITEGGKSIGGHAWLENDNKVVDQEYGYIESMDKYYKYFNPTEIRKYKFSEAMKLFKKKKHYGIWHGVSEKMGGKVLSNV